MSAGGLGVLHSREPLRVIQQGRVDLVGARCHRARQAPAAVHAEGVLRTMDGCLTCMLPPPLLHKTRGCVYASVCISPKIMTFAYFHQR